MEKSQLYKALFRLIMENRHGVYKMCWYLKINKKCCSPSQIPASILKEFVAELPNILLEDKKIMHKFASSLVLWEYRCNLKEFNNEFIELPTGVDKDWFNRCREIAKKIEGR